MLPRPRPRPLAGIGVVMTSGYCIYYDVGVYCYWVGGEAAAAAAAVIVVGRLARHFAGVATPINYCC